MREKDFDGAVALRARIMIRERILFAIGVHGPAGAFDHLQKIRNIHKTDKDGFLEIKQALIEEGMDRSEVMEMVLGVHEAGCACWKCILLLHSKVLRAYHARKVEYENTNGEI